MIMKKVYNMPKVRVVSLATERILAGSGKIGVSNDEEALHDTEVLSKRGAGINWFED